MLQNLRLNHLLLQTVASKPGSQTTISAEDDSSQNSGNFRPPMPEPKPRPKHPEKPSFLGQGPQKQYLATTPSSSHIPPLYERKTSLTIAEVTTQLVRFLQTQDLEGIRERNKQRHYGNGELKKKILDHFHMSDILADNIAFYVLHPLKNKTLEDMVKDGLEDESFEASRVTIKRPF